MKTDTKLYQTLKERGLLYQCTDEEALKKMLESGKPITLYEGTDPTADSLHIGHCVPYCILRRFQKAGHKVIILMGGATACIGDPSGKQEMRKMLTKEEAERNIEKIKETLKVFLDFDGDNPAIIVNNADWFKDINYVDFMREIGVHFNISKMLSNEIYVERIKNGGLTFFEMGYMLMQAYDFVHLNQKYGCVLQYGGQDQWGNIVAGTELQRKLNFQNGTNVSLVGATNPLLMTPEGKKMGKTEKGALWLDPEKTSPYEFFQYWRNIADADVINCMKLLTFMPLDEIARYEFLEGADINKAKEKLAYEVTALIHGEEEACKALEAARNVFAAGNSSADMPTTVLSSEDFTDGKISVVDMLVKSKLAPSKGEAKRLIQQGGVLCGDRKIASFDETVGEGDFADGLIVKKGKKTFHRFIVK